MGAKYYIGDVVRLNSGGPQMTVIHLGGNGDLTVAWFDQDDHFHVHSLPVEAVSER